MCASHASIKALRIRKSGSRSATTTGEAAGPRDKTRGVGRKPHPPNSRAALCVPHPDFHQNNLGAHKHQTPGDPPITKAPAPRNQFLRPPRFRDCKTGEGRSPPLAQFHGAAASAGGSRCASLTCARLRSSLFKA
jgi:hypothetical protein